MYTVFVSYRVASERYHAQLLYEVSNSNMGPGYIQRPMGSIAGVFFLVFVTVLLPCILSS